MQVNAQARKVDKKKKKKNKKKSYIAALYP